MKEKRECDVCGNIIVVKTFRTGKHFERLRSDEGKIFGKSWICLVCYKIITENMKTGVQ